MKTLWTALVLLSSSLPLVAQVSKEEVRKLLDAHLSDQTILAFVHRNGPMDAMSVEDLAELNGAGASDNLLMALIQAQVYAPNSSTEPSYSTPPPDSTSPYPDYSSSYVSSPSFDYSPYYYPSDWGWYWGWPYWGWGWGWGWPSSWWWSSALFFSHSGHHHDGHFHDGHFHDGHSHVVVHDGHTHVVSPGVSTFRQQSVQRQGMTTVRPQTVAPHTMVPHTMVPHSMTMPHGSLAPHGSAMPHGGGGGSHGGGGGHH